MDNSVGTDYGSGGCWFGGGWRGGNWDNCNSIKQLKNKNK